MDKFQIKIELKTCRLQIVLNNYSISVEKKSKYYLIEVVTFVKTYSKRKTVFILYILKKLYLKKANS